MGMAQDNQKSRFFVAYEFGEMAFNRFQNFAGEAGLKLPSGNSVRLVHMNVKLTEQHLSSKFAQSVDGKNVKGHFFGFEGFYDFEVNDFLQISPSIGYFKNEYQHTILAEETLKWSATIGVALSYYEEEFLGVSNLYMRLSIPIRLYLDPLKETTLGDATVNNHTIDNNIWFFIGYQF